MPSADDRLLALCAAHPMSVVGSRVKGAFKIGLVRTEHPPARAYLRDLGAQPDQVVGASDFSSAGGAPWPARFSIVTRASARTLGSVSLSSSRSSGTTDLIPGCVGPSRPKCHAARLRTK